MELFLKTCSLTVKLFGRYGDNQSRWGDVHNQWFECYFSWQVNLSWKVVQWYWK